jgi:predicted flavoprotein YhiN
MLITLPGMFVAGEMLDWEVPTGDYLFNAYFATNLRIGLNVCDWLNHSYLSREISGVL